MLGKVISRSQWSLRRASQYPTPCNRCINCERLTTASRRRTIIPGFQTARVEHVCRLVRNRRMRGHVSIPVAQCGRWPRRKNTMAFFSGMRASVPPYSQAGPNGAPVIHSLSLESAPGSTRLQVVSSHIQPRRQKAQKTLETPVLQAKAVAQWASVPTREFRGLTFLHRRTSACIIVHVSISAHAVHSLADENLPFQPRRNPSHYR